MLTFDRLNRAVASNLSSVMAQFQRGDPVAVIFRQRDEGHPELRSGPREWWVDCPLGVIAIANPTVNEIVVIEGIDYAISSIDIDRTSGGWVQMVVRPAR